MNGTVFPDYAQGVSPAQPTEPTADFPNCPKIAFSQMMGLDFHQALTESGLNPVSFSSCKNNITEQNLC